MFPLLWKKIQDIVGQVAKPDTYGENESYVKYKHKVQYLHVVTRAWHPWETLLDVPSLATRPPQINQDGAGISSGNPNQCGHWMKINYQYTKYVLHKMWTLVPALTCQLITQRGARCIHVVTTVTPPSAINNIRPNMHWIPTGAALPDWYIHILSKNIWFADFSARLANILQLISAVRQ